MKSKSTSPAVSGGFLLLRRHLPTPPARLSRAIRSHRLAKRARARLRRRIRTNSSNSNQGMDLAMNEFTRTSGLSCLAFAAAVAVMSIVLSAPALAAEPPLPAPSWTGFYLGLHGGWGWGTTRIQDETFTSVFNPTVMKYDGPLAGGQVGFNWQLGSVVLGAEVDGSWAFVRGNTSRTAVPPSPAATTGRLQVARDRDGTCRLRHGPVARLCQGRRGAGPTWSSPPGFTPVAATYNRSLVGAVGGGRLRSGLPAQRLRQGSNTTSSFSRPISFRA